MNNRRNSAIFFEGFGLQDNLLPSFNDVVSERHSYLAKNDSERLKPHNEGHPLERFISSTSSRQPVKEYAKAESLAQGSQQKCCFEVSSQR